MRALYKSECEITKNWFKDLGRNEEPRNTWEGKLDQKNRENIERLLGRKSKNTKKRKDDE